VVGSYTACARELRAAARVGLGTRRALRAGDLAAWPKGTGVGHHLINESDRPCRFLAFSGGERSGGGYSDIDLMFTREGTYVHKDGTPYGDTQRPA
jgi:uncharacterized cupin superfamily protein